MKTNVKKIGECKSLLEIELSSELVREKFREVYAELGKKASVPGFRTGKAPQDLLEKHYGNTVREEVTQQLILQYYEKAVREGILTPINSPQIRDVKLEGKSLFSFKAEVETRPEVKLKSYKNLKIKEMKIEVSSRDAEEALLRLQEMNAQLSPISGRVAQEGDWLLCDCKSLKGNDCIENKENAWIALEEKRSPKEFVDGLAGASVGETRTIKEKDVTYSIKVKEIKEKILPALDDNFARDAGKCGGLAELKKMIQDDLIRHNEAKSKTDVKNQLSQQLLKNNLFSCPSSLIEEELSRLVNEAKLRLIYQGVEKEKVSSEEEKIKKELGAEAEKRVRFSFILDQIARQENVSVSPEEIEKRLELIEKNSGRKMDSERKDLIDNLRFQLREEKTIEFLVKEAKTVKQ